MAKIRCVCGTVIPTSGPIPNPLEWKVISDTDFDHFAGLVDAEDVYRACGSLFRCPTCGRLWVYWSGFDSPPECYRPDEAGADADG